MMVMRLCELIGWQHLCMIPATSLSFKELLTAGAGSC